MMFVAKKVSRDNAVLEVPLRSKWNRRYLKLKRLLSRGSYLELPGKFHFQDPSYFDLGWINRQTPNDVSAIMVHWTSGFLSLLDLSRLLGGKKIPVIFVGMDQEHGTGGCHYPGSCSEYTKHCSECPVLPQTMNHIAERGLRIKRNFWANHSCYYIAGSEASFQFASESSILQHGTFERAALPMEIPKAVYRKTIRQRLGLPLDAFVILCTAYPDHVWRKGPAELKEALIRHCTSQKDRETHILIAGTPGSGYANEIPAKCHLLGHLPESELSDAYASADVYVSASIEDAGPMMVSESMLHGTPVVSFPTGIATELIENGKTGFLAAEKTGKSLAAALDAFREHPNQPNMRQAAKLASTQLHSPQRYTDVIRRIISSHEGVPQR